LKTGKIDPGLLVASVKENDARVFLLFVQTAEAALKCSEAVLNKAGLSLVKLIVLQLLQTRGGTLTPSEIAYWTLREKHDITTLVRRMERAQLITTKKSETDNRSINVTITDKGERAITDTLPVARSIYKHLMSSIPESSLEILEQSLKTLRENACDRLQSIK
jgi:MarR family transcriptional regulator, organic hydroperoxide resistance regulator